LDPRRWEELEAVLGAAETYLGDILTYLRQEIARRAALDPQDWRRGVEREFIEGEE